MRNWLIKIRKTRALTQNEVAKSVHISQPSYCNIEKGKINPSPKTAQKIASVLGFDWTVFFNEKGA